MATVKQVAGVSRRWRPKWPAGSASSALQLHETLECAVLQELKTELLSGWHNYKTGNGVACGAA